VTGSSKLGHKTIWYRKKWWYNVTKHNIKRWKTVDCGIVYQLTFFLALGLLAIVITVFVFAVSQVGRATESASKEQQDILLKQKEAKGKQIEKIQGQLEEARKVGHLDEAKLLTELQNTKEEIAGYDAQLRHLQERIMLIRRKGAVVCPGVFFITALVLTITASGLADGQNFIALPLWIISIGALVFGGSRVFRTLGAIEEVTITSQEAMEKLPEAVKVALRELEEEKKPELEIKFKGAQPPFQMKAKSEMLIKILVGITKGDVARNAVVAFWAPPVFKFPDSPRSLPSEKYTSYVSTSIPLGDIIRPTRTTCSIKLKAPSQPSSYTMAYRLFCEGFDSDYKEFKIIVE
jgi:hypothetical protein